MPPTIEERVISVVRKELEINPKDPVALDAQFIDDLGADSLDTVELVMALEEEFHIDIPDDEADKVKIVGDAIKAVEKKLAN